MGDDERFSVKVSGIASQQFRDLKERAAKSPDSTHGKLWNAICQTVREKLPLPMVALSARHALENKKYNFANIYSCGFGRNRILYLASSEKRQVTILMTGYRKSGDAHDVYEELYRQLHGGAFDTIFLELGVAKPPR